MKNSNLWKRSQRYLLEEPEDDLRKQIESLLENEDAAKKELEDRLGKNCHFGTAGIRAKMEAGYNRMNLVSIYRFSHGLAQELLNEQPQPKVVIGFDGRNNSKKFAEEASQVLSLLGLEVVILEKCVPTPLCAYATKYFNALVGVMITASHNPAYDNGVKLFGSNSAQLNGHKLKKIESYMESAPMRTEFYQGKNRVFIEPQKCSELFASYLKEIKKTALFDNESIDRTVSVVYTPLHGVGKELFLNALAAEGYSNIRVVSEQAMPDGNFPTLVFPNPEEEHTLDKAHQLAQNSHSSWVFAHDPDADRLQVSCPKNGEYTKLSGNEMGVILGYFAIQKAKKLAIKPLVASSIVSSRMLKSMALSLDAQYADGLTGFSNIVEKALKAQELHDCHFVFGYEEAIGFLMGQAVLDKDGINAGLRFMEIAGLLKQDKKNIWQLLDELYLRFGVFCSTQWSIRFDGVGSMAKMSQLMQQLRNESPEIAHMLKGPKASYYDLLMEQKNNCYTGLSADVLIFETMAVRLIIRPSGTEPKIKVYLEIMDRVDDPLMLSNKRAELEEKMIGIKNDFLSCLQTKVKQ